MKNIKHLFENEVTKKILLFFNENPHSIDTVKGISIWVNCDADTVEKSVSQLAEHGILINYKTTSIDAYSYTNHKDILKEIEKHIKNL